MGLAAVLHEVIVKALFLSGKGDDFSSFVLQTSTQRDVIFCIATVQAIPFGASDGACSMMFSSMSTLRRRLGLLSAHLVVAVIALVVIGGATRVMEAGLACPDWPLCFGSFLPGRQMNVQVFLEWFHRLDAFVIGIALVVMAVATTLQRRQLPRWLPWLAIGLMVLVAMQGGLGALTVTQLLPSAVVTAHLALALTLVALLSGLTQRLLCLLYTSPSPRDQRGSRMPSSA